MPFKLICRNPVLPGIKFPDTNEAVVVGEIPEV